MAKRKSSKKSSYRRRRYSGRYSMARRMMRENPPSEYYYKAIPRGPDSYERYGPSAKAARRAANAAFYKTEGAAGAWQRRKDEKVYGRGRFTLGKALSGYRKYVPKGVRGAIRTAGRNALSSAGAALGPLGAMAGTVAGDAVFGSGMYAGAGRTIAGSGMYGAPLSNLSDELVAGQRFFSPHFSTGSVEHDDGGLLVTNQEFVQNVYGNALTAPGATSAVGFTSQSFQVNPGLAEIFPMLSQFANNFERYELVQCVFHFETQLDAGIIQSSTGQVGDVLMYSHMDASEPDLQNVADFQMNGGSSARVTQGLMCGVECSPDQMSGLPNAGINYIRTGPKADLGEYDQGKFQLAVSNTPYNLAGQVIGKLFVSYTVKLIKPRIHSLVSRNVLTDTFIGATDAVAVNGTDLVPVIPNSLTALNTNSIGASVAYSYNGAGAPAESGNRAGLHCGMYTITLPSWLQGLLLVECNVRVVSTGNNLPTESSAEHDGANNDVFPTNVFMFQATEGEVSACDFEPVMTVSGTMTKTDASLTAYDATKTDYASSEFFNNPGTLANSSGYTQIFGDLDGADDDGGWMGNYRQHFRVSPSLTVDNVIKLVVPHGTNLSSGTTVGPWYGSLKLTLVNDFDAVGTQSITDVAKLN